MQLHEESRDVIRVIREMQTYLAISSIMEFLNDDNNYNWLFTYFKLLKSSK